MEKRIKGYEEFIKKRLKNPDKELLDYHREVLANFQHERMVHLVIMVFFIILTVGFSTTSTSNIYYVDFVDILCKALLFSREPCSGALRYI